MEKKGQLPDLQSLIVISILTALINNYTNVKVSINWDKLIELSVNAPRLHSPPLWVEALDKLTKIGAQTQIVTELSQRKKLERVI
jgi:hypothetical protein